MENEDYYDEKDSGGEIKKSSSLGVLIRNNKFYFIVLVFTILFVPIFTINDLTKIDNGIVVSERLIFPIGTIYRNLGYWPAALFLPCIIIAFAVFVFFKFFVAKRK